jgi:heat shock protein HtpX
MYEAISSNQTKSYLLVLLVVLLIFAVGWAASIYFQTTALIWAAAAVSLLMSWVGYYYSDKIVLAMSQAHEVTHEQEPHLHNVVEGLALAAGLPKPRLYVIEDTATNAFATGRDPAHAALAVTRGLLEKMNRAQLEGVIAHEMSHVKNYDIRFMTLVSVMVGVVALLSDWMMRAMWWGGGRRRSSRGGGGAQGILMLFALVLMILAPIIAMLIQLAISRRREFLADASGAMLTRYPEGLASALERLAADTEPLEAANKATAHLYIVNPLKGGGLNSLFSTHPPIEERVRRLREM